MTELPLNKEHLELICFLKCHCTEKAFGVDLLSEMSLYREASTHALARYALDGR